MSTILTIRAGKGTPAPLSREIMENFDSAEVTQTDEGPSGFQLTFKAGRNKDTGRNDYQTLVSGALALFNRVVISVKIDSTSQVLIDGIITHHQLNPSNDPGMSTISITGEDVSVKMDLVQKKRPHPSLSPSGIVKSILSEYTEWFSDTQVVDPPSSWQPPPVDFVHHQDGTDLAYVRYLAEFFACDFYVLPDNFSGKSKAYWGPMKWSGEKQPAISVNLKQGGNSDSVNFTFNALAPTKILDMVRERGRDASQKVTAESSTLPPLSGNPLQDTSAKGRQSFMQQNTAGLTYEQALAKAQAELDKSAAEAATATGQVNGFRYRASLQARALVYLRGAGETCDGLFYVKNVTHKLRRGEYSQSFTLNREGGTSTIAAVRTS